MLPEKENIVVQMLVFAKDMFTKQNQSDKWVGDMGFVINGESIKETDESWRYGQRPPSDFKDNSFKTIKLTDGV